MKSLFALVLSVIFFAGIISWKKSEALEAVFLDSTIDYFTFGRNAGYCQTFEECISVYRIQNGRLYVYAGEFSGEMLYSPPLTGEYVELSSDEYSLVDDLQGMLPIELLSDTTTIYGCPNCTDLGEVYLELHEEGELKSWNIDVQKDNIPGYLHDFVDTLRSYLNLLEE